MTTLVGGEYSSYRDLPVTLYQINWKYRDELRPRFGLIRGPRVPHEGRVLVPRRRRRPASAPTTTSTTRTAGCSPAAALTWRAVEAQAGEMGGETNHEFLAVAAVGEDDVRVVPELRLRGERRGGPPPVARGA